jgi:hypothetical protein
MNRTRLLRLSGILLFILISCNTTTNPPSNPDAPSSQIAPKLIHPEGMMLQTRFDPPAGFTRKAVDQTSFAYYLRSIPLQPDGSKVHFYNGTVKRDLVYDAVVNMDIGKQDLQQCADAVMRLRGEYLYAQKAYNDISFTLTNGFNVDYAKWMQGYRVAVNGNKTSWYKSAAPSNTPQDFRKYMDFVFNYAGTLSLAKSLKPRNMQDIAIGDVFIVGGSPGHAVIVMDVAENEAGKKVFMLAQSYMPAQEIQVLKNLQDETISPWYAAEIPDQLFTPQWTFSKGQLKTW